jgi:Tol biopolymer transport system component
MSTRHRFLIISALFAIATLPTPGIAQSLRSATATPISDLRPDWLSEGLQTPNGRFFLFRSFVGDSIVLYDRVNRRWSVSSRSFSGNMVRWSPDGRFIAFVRNTGTPRQPGIWIMPFDSATGMPSGDARRVTTKPAIAPAWSPDSRRLAMASNDSGRFSLVVAPFNGGEGETLYSAMGNGSELAWSPDGKHIAVVYRRDALAPLQSLRIDVASKRVDTLPTAALRNLGFSPDGQRMAHHDNRILVISSASTGRVLDRSRLPAGVVPTGWSRTDPDVIVGVQHVVPATLQRVSLSDGRIEGLADFEQAFFGVPRFSPDGKRIAFDGGTDGARLIIANPDGGNRRTYGPYTRIYDYRWSPNSSMVAYGASIGGDAQDAGDLRVVDAGSGSDRVLVAHKEGATMGNFGWRGDGQAIRYVVRSTTDREIRETTLGGATRALVKLGNAVGAVRYANDTLAVLRKAGGIDAVNLRTGAIKPLYTGSIRAASDIGVSPDGEWIVFAANRNEDMYPQLVSARTGEARAIPYPLKGELGSIDFMPDGNTLVAQACMTCVASGYVERWDNVLIPLTGGSPRVLTASQPTFKDFSSASASPDGKYVLFFGERSYNTRAVSLSVPRR